MTSVTLSIGEEVKSELKSFLWVNWSEIAREEAIKRLIFERYMKKGEISDKEWAFCERIDWHPVDELPLRESFKKEMEKRKKGPFIRLKSVDEIFKH